MPSEKEIDAAADVIWQAIQDLYRGDDAPHDVAKAALEAAEKVREPVVFVTGDHFGVPRLRCIVNGPQYIVVDEIEK